MVSKPVMNRDSVTLVRARVIHLATSDSSMLRNVWYNILYTIITLIDDFLDNECVLLFARDRASYIASLLNTEHSKLLIVVCL